MKQNKIRNLFKKTSSTLASLYVFSKLRYLKIQLPKNNNYLYGAITKTEKIVVVYRWICIGSAKESDINFLQK
jgi:hypothetical protein